MCLTPALRSLSIIVRATPHITEVLLASEEEGVGLAIGAWLGGERTALLMQSSGVGNCINAFAALRTCGVPLLMIVTMRGEWGETNPWQVPMGQTAKRHLETANVITHAVSAADEVAPTVRRCGADDL